MSIEIQNAVWRESKSSGRARLTLLAIADHQGEIGAWPSIETLARMVNASERSVQRDIKELADLGELIVLVQQAPSRGQYKSNLYWVNLPSVAKASGVTKMRSGVTESTSGVTDLASGVTTDGVLTLIEPLLKPNRNAAQKTLDESWQPGQNLLAMFATKWPLLKANEETEAFILYHRGKGSKFVDWDLTYQAWMNRAQKWAAEKQPAQPERKILGDF
jgi:hypothetical protein